MLRQIGRYESESRNQTLDRFRESAADVLAKATRNFALETPTPNEDTDAIPLPFTPFWHPDDWRHRGLRNWEKYIERKFKT